MKSIIKISKRGIIAILTLCILLGNAGTCVNVTAMASETTATVEAITVVTEASAIATEETTAITEEIAPELMPMMARNCGYTSVNQMQQMVLRGQAPSGVVAVHNAHSSVGQPHIHFTTGAINFDGSIHDSIAPSLTNTQRQWITSNGWSVGVY